MENQVQSLPARERGLKHVGNILRRRRKKSLPARERGLKRRYPYTIGVDKQSLPAWGARIETRNCTIYLVCGTIFVAPVLERGLKL